MSENPNEGRLGEWRDDLRQFRKFFTKGARMLAICRAISISRGTQSSFPQIIIKTM
jgi:hypothetical protein